MEDHVLSREQLEYILEDHRDFLRQLLNWLGCCEPDWYAVEMQIKDFLRIIK